MTKTPRVPLLFPGLLLLAGLLVAGGDAVVARLMTWQTPTLREQLRREIDGEKIRRLSTSNLPPEDPPAVRDRADVFALIAMGGQNGRQRHNMHSTIARHYATGGWKQFVEEFVRPQLDWGVRGLLIHLAFGKDPEEAPMSFDSYTTARERGLKVIVRDFGRAMRPIIDGKYTNGERVEVICYLGSLSLDPDFIALRRAPYLADNWVRRWEQNFRPLVNARCSIAFDTGSGFGPDGPEYASLLLLKSLGVDVWIEGTAHPPEYVDHLKVFNWTANTHHYWRNIEPPRGRKRWAPASAMEGRGMLMISGHAMPAKYGSTNADVGRTFHLWAPGMVRRDLDAGFQVAVNVRLLIRAGVTLDQVLTGDNDP